MATNLAAESSPPPPVVSAVAEERAEPGSAGAAGAEALEIEFEEARLELSPPARARGAAPTGFQAFLQHANLHNLLQIESLSRTTGVFLVASQGRRGYLHLSNGELVHAELGALRGEGAAAQILAWDDGEFKSCARPLAAVPTISSSLQALLLRLACDSDEAARGAPQSEPHLFLEDDEVVEDDKPTEPHLPAPSADGVQRAGSSAPPRPRIPPPRPPRDPVSGDPVSGDPLSRDRMSRDPGPRESAVTEVTISPSGELLQGRGIGADELSARVAYAARLADLIGRAIGSGTPQALELKGKGTHTMVHWQSDGSLSASLELVQSSKMR